MSTFLHTFFPDETAYRAWITRIPGIFPCHEEHAPGQQEDPHEPWASTTEGPYYVSPQFLLLRVGSGNTARYCALHRARCQEEADFSWYARASSPEQEGERVYAAYVWDTRTQPKCIVAGDTLQEARVTLRTYQSAISVHGVVTKTLS